MILDHIVAQDVRRLESLDIPYLESQSSQRFRPGGSSSLQGCCNHLPTYVRVLVLYRYSSKPCPQTIVRLNTRGQYNRSFEHQGLM